MIETAVITGAASGIGRALADALVSRGVRVVAADIELDRAQTIAGAIPLFVDHADEDSVAQLAERAFAELGRVDALFANAGVGAGGALYSTPQRNVDWVMAVNAMGPLWMARHFVPRMIEQGTASRFIVTGSEHSLGLPSRGGQASIYTMSKHAVMGLALTLRRDLAQTPVAVSIICPAVVTTEIWNPLRNRQERFGGPRQATEMPPGQVGLAPAVAAERILSGIEADEFYLFTHGAEVAEVHNGYADEVRAAIVRFGQRYGQEA